MRRRAFLLACAGAIAAGALCVLGFEALRGRSPSSGVPGSAAIGGPFTLVDTQGKVFTDRDLLGRPSVVYFGFTYCPEVCPTTLAALSAWMRALGPDADKLNVVFVTVDPERDTPRQMGLYLSSFDHRIRGLTGAPAQVAQAAKAYLVYYQKVPLDGGSYTMDHSTGVYLMDRQGHLQDLIAYQEPSAQALAKLKRLIGG
jgi:protein SCO1/2